MRFKFERYNKPDRLGYSYYFYVRTITPHREVFEWCREQFGPECEPPRSSRWSSSVRYTNYWFRNHADAFAFRMRWC